MASSFLCLLGTPQVKSRGGYPANAYNGCDELFPAVPNRNTAYLPLSKQHIAAGRDQITLRISPGPKLKS